MLDSISSLAFSVLSTDHGVENLLLQLFTLGVSLLEVTNLLMLVCLDLYVLTNTRNLYLC